MPLRFRLPRPTTPLERTLAGPLSSVAIAALAESLRATPLALHNPAYLFVIAVAWTAYMGGTAPALASGAIGVAYCEWYFYRSGSGYWTSRESLSRLTLLPLAVVLVAVLVGRLRRQVERTAAEAAVARRDAEFRMVMDQAGDAIVVASPGGRFLYANPAACALTGYARGELVNLHVTDLVAPESQAERAVDLTSLPLGAEMASHRVFRRKDGSRFRADITVRRLQDGRFVAIMRDVTSERAAQDEQRRMLSLLTATLEATADGILVVDLEGHVVSANRRFREMWGIPEELIEARDDERMIAFVLEQLADPAAFQAQIRELYARPDATSFDTLTFRDGRVFERFSMPQRIDGRAVGRVWSFRDVTEARRQSEALRRSELRLAQAQKLEAVGRLAGGVAHDYNNMLTAILGETELLLQRLEAGSPLRAAVETIRGAAERSARLTRQLLAFGRRQHAEPRLVRLGDVVTAIEPLLRRVAGETVELSLEIAPDAPWARCDPSFLEQALVNLAINARDAMPRGGRITVSARRAPGPPPDGSAAGGEWGLLVVRDTGTGIEPELLPHIFEPFFTTKERGRGTGLGLASVYGVVSQLGGQVEVRSRPGEGAEFTIWIPAAAAAPAEAGAPAAPPATEPAPPKSVSVLLVEDEKIVRDFVATMLRHEGYRVIEASSAEHALAVARAEPGTLDLLLADVVMPGASGPELARALAAERPGLRVLLMSGYAGEMLPDLAPGGRHWPILGKPFTPTELRDAVRRTLADPPA